MQPVGRFKSHPMETLTFLRKLTADFPQTQRMPVLFVGHGSPMNAIEANEFARGWQLIGSSIPVPKAILCISAHWETRGTFITAMEKPATIHDFYGFPQALFEVEYPAPGDPALARETAAIIRSTPVMEDLSWGFDHGSWSILKHFYPLANIPVLEMSMDHTQKPQWHYELARELQALRYKGVLIIGSGNMVHNLRVINWRMKDAGFDWAEEANAVLKTLITEGRHDQLWQYQQLGAAIQQSVPTPEHFIPLLYTLGLQQDSDQLAFFNDKTVMGSISMTSVILG